MTVKEAILESLEKLSRQSTYQEITDYIKSNELYISDGKTLEATVSGLLGDFIRKNDTRIGRLKEGRTYFYYLTKNQLENKIDLLNIQQKIDKKPKIDFYERDLHPLFVSYLKSQNIFSKTIDKFPNYRTVFQILKIPKNHKKFQITQILFSIK